MPLHYLDTSALVKRYLPEIGSGWLRALCAGEPVAISLLAVSEVASALARRAREGGLQARERDDIFRRFLLDVRDYAVLGLTQGISRDAATLLIASPPSIRLRALDALHLATARAAFARAGRRGTPTGSFVTADRALIAAATWVSIPALDPADYP